MLNPKSRLARAINIIYDGVVLKDYDNVLCIIGDEGKGKSNILLQIVDFWLKKRYNTITPEMANRFIAMDSKDLGRVIKGVTNFDILANDEAADLSSRSSMSKINKTYVKAYSIIRGKNLFTILVLPDLFDLDTFFRKRRVRNLIYTNKRGVIHFWGKQRLKKLVEINEVSKTKNYFCVQPLFSDRVPLYKGVLSDPYKKMKEEKISKIQDELYNELMSGSTNEAMNKETETMIKLKEGNDWSYGTLAKYYNISGDAIRKRIKAYTGAKNENEEAII